MLGDPTLARPDADEEASPVDKIRSAFRDGVIVIALAAGSIAWLQDPDYRSVLEIWWWAGWLFAAVLVFALSVILTLGAWRTGRIARELTMTALGLASGTLLGLYVGWMVEQPVDDVESEMVSLNGVDVSTVSPSTGVSVRRGIELTGSYSRLFSGASIWVLDRERAWTVGGPVKFGGGIWTFKDVPIGSARKLPDEVSVTVVLADVACASQLRKAKERDHTLPSLPQTCLIVEEVPVIVEKP